MKSYFFTTLEKEEFIIFSLFLDPFSYVIINIKSPIDYSVYDKYKFNYYYF